MSAPQSLIFKGYEDIVRNFWELDPQDIPQEQLIEQVAQNNPSWLHSDVLFLDVDETDSDHIFIVGMTDESIVTKIKIRSVDKCFTEVFDVFEISGDGGFESFLFRAEDFDKILKINTEIKFVTREVTK